MPQHKKPLSEKNKFKKGGFSQKIFGTKPSLSAQVSPKLSSRKTRFKTPGKKNLLIMDDSSTFRPSFAENEDERLQVVIARAGVAARRKAEELMLEGRVKVDGKIITQLGTKVAAHQQIMVDGQVIFTNPAKVYLVLNKPEGFLTTALDPEERPTVFSVLEAQTGPIKKIILKNRLFAVGRLDFNTEGALLFTNDGVLAEKLSHPRSHIPKEYTAKVRGKITDEQLRSLRTGSFGKKASIRINHPAVVDKIRSTGSNTWLRFVITEGQNRQIHRMVESVGSFVIKLIRTQFGPVAIGSLPVGKARALTEKEIYQLLNPQQKKTTPPKKTIVKKPPVIEPK